MTAYSHILKTKGEQTVRVVFRSSNFKYLTIAVHNLTPENIVLEEAIKKEIKKKFRVVRTIEAIIREWKSEYTTRPETIGLMHTGFLTFAKK